VITQLQQRWLRWVALCQRSVDPLPLALVRIFVPVVLVIDLLQAARLGLVQLIWRSYADGGLSRFHGGKAIVEDLSPLWGGPVTWLVSVLSLSMVALGVAVRPMLVIAILAYSQLGHLFPPGDRAIDRLLRTVLIILLFSRAHERLSLQRWILRKKSAEHIPAWPVDLIKYTLTLMYLNAGLIKLGARVSWIDPSLKYPVLYRILTDPLAGKVDPLAAAAYMPLFKVLGFGTIALECGAFLILTRLCPYWALGGMMMHLGIALTMNIGAFSWGMLSLYPILFTAWILEAKRRLQA